MRSIPAGDVGPGASRTNRPEQPTGAHSSGDIAAREAPAVTDAAHEAACRNAPGSLTALNVDTGQARTTLLPSPASLYSRPAARAVGGYGRVRRKYRRRDSNPRHADFDFAALTSLATPAQGRKRYFGTDRVSSRRKRSWSLMVIHHRGQSGRTWPCSGSGRGTAWRSSVTLETGLLFRLICCWKRLRVD